MDLIVDMITVPVLQATGKITVKSWNVSCQRKRGRGRGKEREKRGKRGGGGTRRKDIVSHHQAKQRSCTFLCFLFAFLLSLTFFFPFCLVIVFEMNSESLWSRRLMCQCSAFRVLRGLCRLIAAGAELQPAPRCS